MNGQMCLKKHEKKTSFTLRLSMNAEIIRNIILSVSITINTNVYAAIKVAAKLANLLL